ncbi:hypothetical protein GCM10007919_51660 [Rhizobium indigoferae]|uniref:IS6 family transposase n=1 Tax=Rhizobium indigoferae TaxID=158891 RepID=UPI00185EBCB5|nr:IS6 family transposase [Rhizobium indigoferae]GLR60437.1 hypothetical protein GCM10007919_51660 [Rhizobium indigoferae]
MTVSAPTYKNDRYPIEIVARDVWLYFRFNLSLRDVEEMLFDFGIVVFLRDHPLMVAKAWP